MPYEFLENSVTSDVTFRVWGDCISHIFIAAADATTSVMVASLESVRPRTLVLTTEQAEELDLLLLRFLEDMIFRKDTEGLLLRAHHVEVEKAESLWRLAAELHGEVLDPTRHDPLADVKAVTLHDLRVERSESGWEAQVTLDV